MNKRVMGILITGAVTVICVVFLIRKSALSRPETARTSQVHVSCPFAAPFYETAPVRVAKKPARAVIVPHHLLASSVITGVFSHVPDSYKTIFLIGPNHANTGMPHIQTSRYVWKTNTGTVYPDGQIIRRLEHSGVAVSEDTFLTEHSVCGLIGFLPRYFPDARVVPIVIKSNTTDAEAEQLGRAIAKSCRDCLVIGSIDFTHEMPSDQALRNDAISADVLTQTDINALGSVIADSPQTLRIVLTFVRNLGFSKSTLLKQSDSYRMSGMHPESVTSYLGILYSSPIE